MLVPKKRCQYWAVLLSPASRCKRKGGMLWVQDQAWQTNALLPRTPTSGNNSLSAAGVMFTPQKSWPGTLVTSEKKAVSTILDQTTVAYIRKGYGPCLPRREKTHTKLFKTEKVHHLFPLTRWARSCFFVWPEYVWRSTLWPAIYSQTRHPLAPEGCSKVKIRYMVPVVSPHTALGVAVAQEIHDQKCESSPATAMARATKYFYFWPSAGNLFQSLQDDCFKCRHIRILRAEVLLTPYSTCQMQAWCLVCHCKLT